MTYKYYEEIVNRGRKFDLINTSNTKFDLSEYSMYLKPMYFNNKGGLYYSGNNHTGADIRYCLAGLLRLFSSNISILNGPFNFDKNYRELSFKKFTCADTLSLNDVRPYFNYGPEPYYDLSVASYRCINAFTDDAMLICNDIKEAIFEIKKQIYHLGVITRDRDELLTNLFKFLKINVNEVIKEKERNYLPFAVIDDSYYILTRYIYRILNDVITQFLGFDKIETSRVNCISTTKRNIYETYFNYMIMGYTIATISRIVYDEVSNDFSYEPILYADIGMEREYKKEVEMIKRLVPLEDRYKYLI